MKTYVRGILIQCGILLATLPPNLINPIQGQIPSYQMLGRTNWTPIIIAVVGIGILVLWQILATTKHHSQLGAASEISVEDESVRGKGQVGAIGADLHNPDTISNLADFRLSYSQITSVSTSGDYLTIVAGASQYLIKSPNAQSAATKIQRNMTKNRHQNNT
ncbi:MAG: hypothetical protein FWB71_02195 [Defluviitaleaceae bacterium]|nr:hypothetical protein [Defluviitaleaceae bacterium]